MSKERYYELYRQFLNHSISEQDFQDLMDWVSDPRNDVLLKKYMEELWSEESWSPDAGVKDWYEVRTQLLSSFPGVFHRTNRSKEQPRGRERKIWIYAVAGILLLMIGLFFFIPSHSGVILYQTAYGETQQIELSDGTMVTLNANSTLEWDNQWKRSGERYVRLQGEAYFDVAKTPLRERFTVETDDLRIRVLGTAFNVSARRDQTGVTLEKGKIELDLKASDEPALAMEPGDFIRYSSVVHTLEKGKVQSIKESASWLDGILVFENVTVAEMFDEIEDQYGKKLISSDSTILLRRMFTGIPYEDWAVAKEALELALGVKIEEKGDKLYMK